MEQSLPRRAHSYSASQEIPCLLWNTNVHHRVHKSPLPLLVPILSKMNPDHTFPPYFPKIHSNITLLSMPRSSECLFPSGFPTKTLYAFLISPMPHPNHPQRFDRPNNIWWNVRITKILTMQSSPVFRHSRPLRSKLKRQTREHKTTNCL